MKQYSALLIVVQSPTDRSSPPKNTSVFSGSAMRTSNVMARNDVVPKKSVCPVDGPIACLPSLRETAVKVVCFSSRDESCALLLNSSGYKNNANNDNCSNYNNNNNNNNCKKLFKLQIRPPSQILLITTSQDR